MDKKNSSKKEFMMIIVVVVLAFGLTVTGVIYLTSSLFGSKEPVAPVATQSSTDDENVVRFVLDDELENTDMPATQEPVIPAPESYTTPAPTPIAKPTPEPAPKPATAQPAPKPAPQVASKPTTPQVVTKPVTTGKYVVQVGAFRSESSALAEAKRLSTDFPDVFVMKVDLGADGVWYRVRCCSTNSKESADKIKVQIENKFSVKPIVQAQ